MEEYLALASLFGTDFQRIPKYQCLYERFFDSNRASCIDKVTLSIGNIRFKKGVHDDPSYPTSWIDAAVKRKIQHLHVLYHPYTSYELPPRLYTCKTLVSLNLEEVNLDNVKFVSLPCLKTMRLKDILFSKHVFEKLVSYCPVLEKLKVFECEHDHGKVFRVLSRSLKELRIVTSGNGSGFVIDAPRLCSLGINDCLSLSPLRYIIKDMDSKAKVDISVSIGFDFLDEANISSRIGSIRSFLSGISKVGDLSICRDTYKLICQYSKIEPLPHFGYMSCLWVSLRVSGLDRLPTILDSCPNLKSLILVWNGMHFKELYRIHLSSVPECLLSSLEFIDIKTSISGHYSELNVVRYFLENSPILKQLTLRLNYYRTNEKHIVKKIMKIPRRSITCKLIIY